MNGPLTCKVCQDTPEYPTGQINSGGFICMSCLRKRDPRYGNKNLIIAAVLALAISGLIVLAKHFF